MARASPRQVHVTLGDYVINSAVEPLPAYTFGVRKIDVHPYFKFTPQADRFDVSVLTLERTVHYMPHIGERTESAHKNGEWVSDLFGILRIFVRHFCSSHLFAGEERGLFGQIRLGSRLGRSESGLAITSEDAASRRCASY